MKIFEEIRNILESKIGDEKSLTKLAKGSSSKLPGGVSGSDRDDMLWAADMIKHNDFKGLQMHLKMLDTAVKDAILMYIDKKHWKKLGFNPMHESIAEGKIEAIDHAASAMLKFQKDLSPAMLKKARTALKNKDAAEVNKILKKFTQFEEMKKTSDKKCQNINETIVNILNNK